MGGGGGGGGGSIQFRKPAQERQRIQNWYNMQRQQNRATIAQDPLLQAAQTSALDYQKQLPGMLAQFPGYQKELGGYQGQVGAQQALLTGLEGGGGTFGGAGAGSSWAPANIAAAGGALTPGMARNVAQQTRGIESAQGTAQGTGALGTELLNRDAARQARYNTALAQTQGLAGQIGGLAGIGAGLTGQKAGLLGQEQALQSGGLDQLNKTALGAVSATTALGNPILGYLGGLYGGNLQASVDQAKIQAQQEAAGKGASGQIGGAAIGAVGSIVAGL